MTQPTLQASQVAREMADALELVDVVRVGHDRMEAHHRDSGQLLGTAVRSSHPQSDWIGWLVRPATEHSGHEIVISSAVAEVVLLYLAAGAR